jgi:hypothetical protein
MCPELRADSTARSKSEIRISKSETNSKSEFLNVQNKYLRRQELSALRFGHLDFGDSDLFRASDLIS